MKTADFIIVIGRSFGSGGRAIGKEMSAILDIPYYDKELLQKAAVEFGFSSEIFAKADERRPSLFKRLVTRSYGVQETFTPEALSAESLYEAQSRVIKGIAGKGSCIIVGRTADYILRNHPGLVSVFLHAPEDYRARKIMERGDSADISSARELARKRDREREAYYHYFTGRNWGKADNYHLTFDASMLPTEEIATLITSLISSILAKRN